MNLYKYTYKYLLVFLAMMVGFTSCVLDDIEMPEDPSSPDITAEEYNLSFNINLQSLQSRDGLLFGDNFEDYEDYIDATKTFILFFTQDDKLIKKFSYKDLSLLPVRNSNDESTKQWVVRIPISKMKDGETFAEQLRKDPFKIAVLANWSNEPKLDEQEIKEDGTIQPGDDLDFLHHQSDDDDSYFKDEKKRKIYEFLYSGKTDKGYMGFSTDWVKNNKFNKIEEARTYIRDNWNPSLSENSEYPDYKDLWLLWNFGGADNIESDFSSKDNNKEDADEGSSNALKYPKWAGAWEKRNGSHLRGWITGEDRKPFDNENPDAYYNPEEQIRSLNLPLESDENEINYLAFKTKEGARTVITPGEKTGESYYGVKLPVVEPQGNKVGDYKRMNPANESGYFSFMAQATGTLFIKARNVGNNGSGNARITAQVGYTGTKVDLEIPYKDGKIQTIEKKIPITGNADWVYIFNRGTDNTSKNLSANDVEIYQIEYVQDDYLYSTDRKGIAPSEQPIEMYGIQQFEKLEKHWEKGTSFDLSNFNKSDLTDYKYSSIMLLRSVAKVELMVPTSYDPSYVYLRSVNRRARWEPVDISSNTSEIWEDLGSTSAHPKNCEWFSIRGQEPFYKPDTDNETSLKQAQAYQKKLAWYYGSWANNGTFGKIQVPGKNEYWSHKYVDKTDRDYPHIMNALIERSDFVEFIEAPTQEPGYKRFVLYIGEKYVDDPNDVGEKEEMETSKPKVCHIEFRKGKTYNTNFDDNNCIRIYFIEGGVKSGFPIPDFQKNEETGEYKDWEHTYEQDVEKLQEHWPIMRNHVYSFRVKDSGSLMPLVDLKVLPWRVVEDQNNYDW